MAVARERADTLRSAAEREEEMVAEFGARPERANEAAAMGDELEAMGDELG